MAGHAGPRRLPAFSAATAGGRVALAVFGLAILLLAGRVFLAPLLPLSFLTVFLAVVASGAVALYAVALRGERGLSVLAVLAAGALAAALLAAESFGGSGQVLVKPAGTALGSGSTYFFWFDSGSRGGTEVSFAYRRAWETGVAPIRTYRVAVNVT
jgi:hypothetical protein